MSLLTTAGMEELTAYLLSKKLGKTRNWYIKKLVTQGSSGNIYVSVIPVESELDLKKAAKITGEMNIALVPPKDIQKLTGYVRGGCSPIGMIKHYPTFIDSSALKLTILSLAAAKSACLFNLA